MKKLLIYIALLLILIVSKLSGLIAMSWATISLIVATLIVIACSLIGYGFWKSVIDEKKTRKFWEQYRRDHEDLNEEEL